MPTKIATLLFTALTCLATTCGAALLDKEIAFSEAEIQAALAKSDRRERNYGGLFTVALLDAPKVTVGYPEGRIGLVARVDIAVLGNPPVPVNVSGTAGIRYDDKAKAFFLENPQAESVESPALPREAEPRAKLAVNALMAGYFKSRPVYILRENGNAQEVAARWLLRSVRVEAGKVIAVLSPF